MAFVYEHGTPRLNGSLGNARGQHVIEKTWINKTIFFWPWKWQQKRDWVICHFQKCSHGYIITHGYERRDLNFVCWTNTVYCYHFMAECLTIKYRLTFLLKYLFFRVADHLEPELVWNHFEMISFPSQYGALFSLGKNDLLMEIKQRLAAGIKMAFGFKTWCWAI